METRVQEALVIGVARNSNDPGDRLVTELVGSRIRCELKKVITVDAQVEGGGATKVPMPVTAYRALAPVVGMIPEEGKGAELWVDTSLIALGDIPPRIYMETGGKDYKSPYFRMFQLSRAAVQLGQGATVYVSQNDNTNIKVAQALLNYRDVRFVASFELDANMVGHTREEWAIEVLKNPILIAAVEDAINNGFKGTLPPKEWEFMKDELTSLVFGGDRVWGLKAEYSAAYLGIVNLLEQQYSNLWQSKPVINKEFGEGV